MKKLRIVDSELCVGCQLCMFACARRSGEAGLAYSSIAVRSAGGMEKGFKVIVCNACVDPPCAAVCPTDALICRDDGGVRLDAERCIGCYRCAEACAIGAVQWDAGINKPMICIQCGFCARYCPHGVLMLAEV